MNLKEFKSLKENTTTYLINYEHFLKRSNLLDLKYYHYFGKTISKILYLRNDTDLMFGIANLYKDEKVAELDNLLSEQRKKYNAESIELNKKILKADQIFNSNISEEDIKKLDESFDEVIEKYHPALTMSVNQNERQSYEMLKNLFYDNNVLGYFAYYDLCINNFKEVTDDVDYDKVGAFYQKIIYDIRAYVVEHQTKYPFNYKDLFDDEILIAKHQGELDVEYTRLLEENKALHTDITNLLKKDIKL